MFPTRRSKLLALILMAASFSFAHAQNAQVTLAALNLPPGSEGLFHLRTGDAASVPVQASTRYFSDPVDTGFAAIELYAAPVGKDASAVQPLLRLPLGERAGSCHVLLWNEHTAGKEGKLAGRIIAAAEWPAGSMLLLNASAVPIGVQAGDTRQMLKAGASHPYPAVDPEKDLPVKMYLEDDKHPGKPKLVFSSVWRVARERRELCVIYPAAGSRSVAVRSLLERPAPATP